MSTIEMTIGRSAGCSRQNRLQALKAEFWKWWIGLYADAPRRRFLPYI